MNTGRDIACMPEGSRMYLELAGSHHCDSEEQLRETEEHEAKPDPAHLALDVRIGPGVTVRVNPERSLKASADRVAKSALPSGRPHLPPNGERRGEDVQEPVPKRCTPDQDEADADGSVHAHTVDDARLSECSLMYLDGVPRHKAFRAAESVLPLVRGEEAHQLGQRFRTPSVS